jgi:hypothetical protein
MAQKLETPPIGAAGLDDDAFPGGNCISSIAPNPNSKQAAIVGLRRDFVAECLRIAALKINHAADNVELGDDLAAERDIQIALSHWREGTTAFRELHPALARGKQ